MKTYNFHLNGEKGTYQISFAVDSDNISSSCDCNYQSDKKYCWHRFYILASKRQRLPKEEYPLQDDLVRFLSHTKGGRELISTAKATFGETETCRRCNSSSVFQLKRGMLSKLVAVIIPTGRKHICRSCGWSW